MFESARFRRLASAQWSESWRTWAWFLAIGILLHFLIVLGSLLLEDGFHVVSTEGQGTLYLLGLFTTAPIFAGRYFQAMARRESAGVLLMRPASAFEHWMLAVLVVAILYPLAYSLAFYVCNLPAWLVARDLAGIAYAEAVAEAQAMGRTAQAWSLEPQQFRLFLPSDWLFHRDSALPLVLLVTGVQAFAVLGSLVFRTLPFIKTLVLGVGLVVLSVLLPGIVGGAPGEFFEFWDRDMHRDPLQWWLYAIAWFAVPALLWLASWQALREREVA